MVNIPGSFDDQPTRARVCKGVCPTRGVFYLNTIKKKKLPLHYQGFITESYGAFGTEAWSFINKVAKIEAGGGDPFAYSPWGRPDWKRHFILSIGFAIQRGNAAMLVRSDLRRRTNSRSFRTSGPRY